MFKNVYIPSEKAKAYFQRAKRLYLEGGKHAIVVERVLKDMLRAMSLHPQNPKHYLFLAKVYFSALDTSCAIYCYRIALKIEPSNYGAREKLANCLGQRGQELLCEAYKFKDDKSGYDRNLYAKAKYCFDEGKYNHNY
jgi:tetratricopeptide (TPR) repeat protein